MTRHYRAFVLFIGCVAWLSAAAVQVNVGVSPARCGLDNGEASANATGGLPPYSYQWDDGPTSKSRQNLAAGTYTVTVTDGQGETAQATATVEAVWELAPGALVDEQPDCDGMCSAHAVGYLAAFKGTPPYTSDWDFYDPVNDYPNAIVFLGLCSGQANYITVTDANGCANTYMMDPPGVNWVDQDSFQSLAACNGEDNGAIIVSGMGGSSRITVTSPSGPDQVFFGDALDEFVIDGLAPGTYYVMVEYLNEQGDYQMSYCTGAGTVVVEQIDGPCGGLSGTIYHDVDQDCTFSGDDFYLPYRTLIVQPGDQYVMANMLGGFAKNLGYGDYTLEQVPGGPGMEEQTCPEDLIVPFTLDALSPSAVIDFANFVDIPHDVKVAVQYWTAFRPGFPYKVITRVINPTPYPSGDLVLTLDFDPVLDDGATTPGHREWTIPPLGPYHSAVRTLTGIVPADLSLLGETFLFTAEVTNTLPEDDLSNNVVTWPVTVTGSYDPNDKYGVTDRTQQNEFFILDADEWIDYTVRFQNTGTDTAFTVVVRDELSEDLAIGTLEILGASHDFVPSFGEGRELVFTFDDILLPDSTTDLLESNGYVAYRIKPRAAIEAGDVIENTAAIYFDFNDPVITNTTAHEVAVGTIVREEAPSVPVRVHPNPANDVLYVHLPDGVDRAVRVIAVDGRPVQVPGHAGAQGFELQVGALAPGAYLVHTAAGTTRFIKM